MMRLLVASVALALLAQPLAAKMAPTSPVCHKKSFPHTACYNYYYKKDGCVHGAVNEAQRCKVPKPEGHHSKLKLFRHPSEPQKRLQKRYDDPAKTYAIGGGDGICGYYNTTIQEGVCLWSGLDPSGVNASAAGWLNGANVANCGKKVYIMRKGDPKSVVYAPILDGCQLLADDPPSACPRIALTIKTFNSLVPKGVVITNTTDIGEVTWDFINLDGNDTANGAY